MRLVDVFAVIVIVITKWDHTYLNTQHIGQPPLNWF